MMFNFGFDFESVFLIIRSRYLLPPPFFFDSIQLDPIRKSINVYIFT